MKEVEVVQLIRTRLLRKGNGDTTPIRIIEQYWSMDGELVFEDDPSAEIVTPERLPAPEKE